MHSQQSVTVTRHGPGGPREAPDTLAVEEPLEIRLDGHPVAVIMRTPGHDRELAAGFLLTEGIISTMDDLRKLDDRPDDNRVLAFLRDGVQADPARLSRAFLTGSSCGLCGKTTLDAVFTHLPPIDQPLQLPDEILLAAPAKLLEAQATFHTTGGLHAAGLFDATGALLLTREDIGRHNAVDKVLGHALLHGIDTGKTFLLVSGRLSFEIMQKALAARIPVVAAISAPSSLAVSFARQSRQALIAFLRPPTFNRYA